MRGGTDHRGALLSSCARVMSLARIVTKSKKMALFSQHMTRKRLPRRAPGLLPIAGRPPSNAAAMGASDAADRANHCDQNRTSSS